MNDLKENEWVSEVCMLEEYFDIIKILTTIHASTSPIALNMNIPEYM